MDQSGRLILNLCWFGTVIIHPEQVYGFTVGLSVLNLSIKNTYEDKYVLSMLLRTNAASHETRLDLLVLSALLAGNARSPNREFAASAL